MTSRMSDRGLAAAAAVVSGALSTVLDQLGDGAAGLRVVLGAPC